MTKSSVSFEEIVSSWRRERPDLALDNMLLTICIARMSRLIDARYSEISDRLFGCPPTDLQVLLALRRSGRPYALRPTDLFKTLLITSGAVTKKIDRLMSLGLVTRHPDPLHAGGFLVHLTAKGLKLVEAVTDEFAIRSPVAKAMENVSPEEKRAGLAFCASLIRELEREVLRD